MGVNAEGHQFDGLNLLKRLVAREGVEPPTHGFSVFLRHFCPVWLTLYLVDSVCLIELSYLPVDGHFVPFWVRCHSIVTQTYLF